MRDIIIFRLIHGYKIVAVMPCEKLMHGVENQFSSASETVPMHFCGSIKALTIMVILSRGVYKQNFLKIISKIGTYSYCTPLLICVGDCTTVLVVWSPIILKYIIAGEWNGLSHMAHNHVIAGSTPVLQQLSHFIWELVGFGSEDEKF